jgi:hypothetical protein
MLLDDHGVCPLGGVPSPDGRFLAFQLFVGAGKAFCPTEQVLREVQTARKRGSANEDRDVERVPVGRERARGKASSPWHRTAEQRTRPIGQRPVCWSWRCALARRIAEKGHQVALIICATGSGCKTATVVAAGAADGAGPKTGKAKAPCVDTRSLEATVGFEPTMGVLQTLALPLGYVAGEGTETRRPCPTYAHYST